MNPKPLARRCSNCNFYPVWFYTNEGKGKLIPEEDRYCPKCGRHPSVTPW